MKKKFQFWSKPAILQDFNTYMTDLWTDGRSKPLREIRERIKKGEGKEDKKKEKETRYEMNV